MRNYQFGLVLALVLAFLITNIRSKEYSPQLPQDVDASYTISSASPILYFRLQVPYNETNKYIEVAFSACSGQIKIYRTQCSPTTDASCDDKSDKWFPDSTNAQHTYYTRVSDSIQATQSFGRFANQPDTVFFFGVEAVQFDPENAVQLHAIFRTYDASTIAHSFISSNKLSLSSSLQLTWQQLEYCVHADASGTKCDKYINLSPIKYTVYVVKADYKKYNLGTACGLIRMGSTSLIRASTGSSNKYDLSSKRKSLSNGNYIIGVAGDVPDPKYSVDFAYLPMPVYYYSTTNNRPVVVIFLLIFIAGVLAVSGVGGYYLYKKKYSQSDEGVPLR